MKLSRKIASKSHRLIIYGPPKSGKTKLVGQLSEKFNLLWFDLENGVDTLKQLPIEWQDRVEVVQIPDTKSFPVAVETMLKVIKGYKCRICELHGKVSCTACAKNPEAEFVEVELSSLDLETIVVIDSITQYTSSVINNVGKNQPEDYKFEYDDWLKVGKLMDSLLSEIQNAKFHMVCISHETDAEMIDGKDKIVPAGGTRNFARNMAKYFDEVIYCEVKNGSHIAGSATTYANRILTGSRSGTTLELLKNPSLLPIFTGEIILPPKEDQDQINQRTSSLSKLSERLKLKQGT